MAMAMAAMAMVSAPATRNRKIGLVLKIKNKIGPVLKFKKIRVVVKIKNKYQGRCKKTKTSDTAQATHLRWKAKHMQTNKQNLVWLNAMMF